MNRDYARALAGIRDTTVRSEVADVLGAADRLSRHLPLYDVPEMVEALWLAYVATDDHNAERFTEPARRALASIAAEALEKRGGRLDLYAALDDVEGPQTA